MGDNIDVNMGSSNLQDSFKVFMEKKKREKAEQQRVKEAAQKLRKNPDFKQILRKKFIEQARSYLGVPYAKRFHDLEGNCSCDGCVECGRQLGQDPLFLDCCALVRKCVSDLAEDFGFKLGPGNQAYQFDTLPLRVGSVADLEPGDLIFYSGEYYNPKSKRQVFDMTHVEIFVGGKSGEGVIGSRERQKWVKEYDSFQFESKNWKLLQFHFCKIDPWLEGVCEPSGAHEWSWLKSRPPSAVKSAIFQSGAAAQQTADGENADGDD